MRINTLKSYEFISNLKKILLEMIDFVYTLKEEFSKTFEDDDIWYSYGEKDELDHDFYIQFLKRYTLSDNDMAQLIYSEICTLIIDMENYEHERTPNIKWTYNDPGECEDTPYVYFKECITSFMNYLEKYYDENFYIINRAK